MSKRGIGAWLRWEMSWAVWNTRKRARLPSCSEPLLTPPQRGPGTLTPWMAAQGSIMSYRGLSFWSAYSAPRKVPLPSREFGEQMSDLRVVLGRAALVDASRDERHEFVDLKQRGRFAAEGGDQPHSRREPLAPPIPVAPGLDHHLLDHLAGVILAAATLGDAEHVEVGAEVALSAHLSPHQLAERGTRGTDREAALRSDRRAQDVADEQSEGAAEPVDRRRRRNGDRWVRLGLNGVFSDRGRCRELRDQRACGVCRIVGRGAIAHELWLGA